MGVFSYVSKEYKKYKRRRARKKKEARENSKEIKFLTKVVVFCITFIVLYTSVQTFLSYRMMAEVTPTLTPCVFAFFGTELCMCVLIKILDKNKNDNDPGDSGASG